MKLINQGAEAVRKCKLFISLNNSDLFNLKREYIQQISLEKKLSSKKDFQRNIVTQRWTKN
jgi:hypothetical protein